MKTSNAPTTTANPKLFLLINPYQQQYFVTSQLPQVLGSQGAPQLLRLSRPSMIATQAQQVLKVSRPPSSVATQAQPVLKVSRLPTVRAQASAAQKATVIQQWKPSPVRSSAAVAAPWERPRPPAHPFDYPETISHKPRRVYMCTPYEERADQQQSEWRCRLCGAKGMRDKPFIVEHYAEHKRLNDAERRRAAAAPGPSSDAPELRAASVAQDGLAYQLEATRAALERARSALNRRELAASRARAKATAPRVHMECPVCPATFVDKAGYRKHILVNHRSGDFYCEECKANFQNAFTLSVHNKKHNRGRYLCTLCGLSFRGTKSMRCHVECCHRPRYRCDECGNSFHTEKWYRDHTIFHNLYIDEGDADAAAAAAAAAPARHLSCDRCDMSFPFPANLEAHVAKVHPTNPTTPGYVCDVCGKDFATKGQLKTHLDIHDPSSRIECRVCGKTVTKRFMPKHELTVHAGEKPYECSTCGKRFTQRSTLVIHTRSHTGERPYVCAFCGKGHVSRSVLNSHRRSCRVGKKRKKSA